jgi:hypothetical protein
MLEYRYFSTERAITYSQSGSIYSVIGDTPVRSEELSPVCRLVGWSILSENRSPVITYTTFHYSSEIHGKNQWNPTRKDNFIIHNSYKDRTTIHWDRFIWVQSNSCFTVLYRKSKTYEKKKKIHQLSLTADVLQQIICTIKIRCAPTRHDHRFSTTHNKDIRNLTIVSGYRWQGIRMIAKTITY